MKSSLADLCTGLQASNLPDVCYRTGQKWVRIHAVPHGQSVNLKIDIRRDNLDGGDRQLRFEPSRVVLVDSPNLIFLATDHLWRG